MRESAREGKRDELLPRIYIRAGHIPPIDSAKRRALGLHVYVRACPVFVRRERMILGPGPCSPSLRTPPLLLFIRRIPERHYPLPISLGFLRLGRARPRSFECRSRCGRDAHRRSEILRSAFIGPRGAPRARLLCPERLRGCCFMAAGEYKFILVCFQSQQA